MEIQDLLNLIKDYAPEDKQLIIRAYEFAYSVHKGVKRKSKEPYINHPVAVACILAEMHADVDTICAGLLHDVIEDGKVTVEDLARIFNPTIAYLVDGVSKLPKFGDEKSEGETDEYNKWKMLMAFIRDIRVAFIKLADRLHNMRTLKYHKHHKQIENAQETMDIFVPFAAKTGSYSFKHELEDLSFSYLEPENYAKMQTIVSEALDKNFDITQSLICQVSQMLNSNYVKYDIELKPLSLYSLFKKLNRYDEDITQIHDLIAITILLDEIEDCYKYRGQINSTFPSIPSKAKDYIARPKSNMYSALHTTIIAPNKQMIQFKLNTNQMYLVNNYGISAYWDLLKFNHAPERMQEEVRKMPFYKDLKALADDASLEIKEFNQEVLEDILNETIYLKTPQGDPIELPVGSTPVDFAYKIHADMGNGLIAAIVNGERVSFDCELQSGDVVNIIFDNSRDFIGPRLDLLNMCKTQRAKKLIRKFHENCKKQY